MRVLPNRRLTRPHAFRLGIGLPLVALIAQVLLMAPVVQAGAVYPNPPNATPVAWPSSFTSYTTDTGTAISDVESETGVGPTYDISSGGGGASSVLLSLSAGAAFFRVRVGTNPIDTTKGGFDNATWLVLIATEDSPGVWTTKAVTGVDGKPVGSAASPDRAYVGNAPGTGITDVYQFTKDAPAFDPLNAVGTGARVVAAGGGQYFIDWQVPVSTLAAVSGNAVTASTPVRLFFGSSAAANLATINKDYMTGAAVSFAGLATVTLSPPTLTLTESKTSISGPNPPQALSPSMYDITVTALNSGGSSLFAPSIVTTIPAGVSIVSSSSATGTIGAVGQTVTWSPGTMLSGSGTISATIRVSVTPAIGDVGSTVALANAAAGTGSDGSATITGTGTAQSAGPVADVPHTTTTVVSCPAGPIDYGTDVTCTVTVTDTSSSGSTVPTGTVAMTGTLGTSTTCTLASASAASASCTVTFTATGVGSGSLSGTYGGDAAHASSSGASGTIPIVKKDLGVSVVGTGKTYGDANPGFSVTYSGFALSDTSTALGGTLAFSTAATSASSVGSYAVTASGLTSANYAFTYSPANLTIASAALTITADPQSRAYGEANPTLTATYTGFVNGEDPTDLTTPAVLATTATPASPAGTYPITVSGATAANYVITPVAGTLTVGTAVLTVTADDLARLYGAADPAFTATITGFRDGDTAADLSGALSCSTTAVGSSNVGTYPITCSGYASSDYTFSYVAGDLSVAPATITVTPDPQARAYGSANPALTVSFGGFENGDTAAVISGSPACSTAATGTSSPGTHEITCTAGTLSATNYVFDVTGTANLTVSTAALTIAVDPATKVYGSANPTFSVTPTGLQNDETIADLVGTVGFSTLAGPTSDVGSYAVTASGLASPNYAITFVDGSLSITKATIVVTPQNTAVAVGDPIPTTWAVDYAGLVAGDDTSVLSGAASCSADATAGDPAGDYAITCTIGTLRAANYDFAIGGTGTFTIGSVTLHVTVDDATKGYGDPNPTFTVTHTGFIDGDDESSLGGSLIFSTAAVTGSPVGTYPVAASGLTSPDYIFDYIEGTLTIEQATQAITFGALATASYGDAPFDLTATSTSGLTVTFTASGGCTVSGVTVTITGAGSCTITAHQAGTANYAAAADAPQTLTIARGAPIVTWATPADITYGIALSGTQLNASAPVGGSYIYSPAGGTVLAAGTHTLLVTFTPSDNGNYESVTATVDVDVLAASQTIDFPQLDNVSSDHDPIILQATSSSGLPITYTVTGACSVVGAVLTTTGTGTCVVTARQDGNSNHDAASPVSVSFEITAPLGSSITTDRNLASPGGHVVVTATGFMPGSSVQVWIQPDGDRIAATADADGNIEVTLTIPPGTAAGPLTIEALGVDPNGAVLDLTTTISIIALPSTSTLNRQMPSPIGSVLAIVLGLFLFMIAAGVQATTASGSPARRRRPRARPSN
ncbi:MAG: hypothetical protein M3Q66_10245 [Chloroflexota bacterium]|nr:hypothetical protein [Chloroflexota bacterium]